MALSIPKFTALLVSLFIPVVCGQNGLKLVHALLFAFSRPVDAVRTDCELVAASVARDDAPGVVTGSVHFGLAQLDCDRAGTIELRRISGVANRISP